MFHLYTFKDQSGKLHATRGRNAQEAGEYLIRICGMGNLTQLDFNYAHSAYMYSANHPFDWLNQPPLWLGGDGKAPKNPMVRAKFYPSRVVFSYQKLVKKS